MREFVTPEFLNFTSAVERELIAAANRSNTHLSNTIMTPDDSSEIAANVSA